MFSHFVLLKTSIRTTLALIDKPIEVLSPEEWVIASEITTALQPMKEITDHISEDPSGGTVEMSSDTPSTSSTLVTKKLAAFNTYRRIAANYKPAGIPMARAITEVQRYLEEPLPCDRFTM
ncbi:unnamed protein product [Nezara viridula]|uniref:Uncharacterized protein n=1 Tax=Nezara viridula TaxID=85310 RepID=A0A9P0EDE0_NEZVI|nr:unnamed protein product [Nezara viridula]